MKKVLNTFKTELSLIFFLGLFSACLPMEKKTQCGDNEAFNATQRKCVPVVGAASGNTVFINGKSPTSSYTTSLGQAPITHTISVSDVYGYGYSVVWKEDFVSTVDSSQNYNNHTVSTNNLTYVFNPPSTLRPDLQGSYLIEAQIFDSDGVTMLDSVNWTVTVADQTVPQITNLNPNTNVLTYASSLTTATVSADITNGDARSVRYTWYMNSSIQSGPFTSTSTTISTSLPFNPSIDLGTGIHTIELLVEDSVSGSQFDSHSYMINVVDPDRPVIASGDPAFTETIIAIDGESYATGGYFYSSDYLALNATGAGNADPGLCITVDNWDKDGDGNPDLDVKFDINGQIQGAVANISSNTYCLTTINAINLASPQIGVSKTITASTYLSGTSTLIEQKQWALNIVPRNQAPTIAINTTAYANMSDCSANTLAATGCTATQSIDDDGDGLYDGSNDSAVAGYTISDTDNVVQVALNVRDVESFLAGVPAAYNEDQIEVFYQIKKSTDTSYQDLDSTASYSKSDCTIAAGVPKTDIGPTAGWDSSYACLLRFDGYDSSGLPIAEGVYNVKAFIRDPGSQWATMSPQESNHIEWTITVGETNSQPIIEAQDPTDYTIPGNLVGGTYRSWVEIADSSCVGQGTLKAGDISSPSTAPPALNQADENDFIIIHTLVKDVERDSLNAEVKLKTSPSTGYILSPTSTVTNTYNSEGYVDVQRCVQIPEFAVSTGASTVDFEITITESTDSNGSNSTTNNFGVYVNNQNPEPYFADYSDEDLLDRDNVTAGDQKTYAYAGYPFTITPPAHFDDSVYDGKNVEWQWQVCVGLATDGQNAATENCDTTATGGGWADIPNADHLNMASTELEWTPSLDLVGNRVALRLCLGDDGVGNPADCTNTAVSRKSYTNITVINPKFNMAQTATDSSSGTELAVWHDDTNERLYTAYASGTKIVVEKQVKETDTTSSNYGSWVSDYAISFETEDTNIGKTPVTVTDLSMEGLLAPGNQDSLYIAYRVVESSSSIPQIRVRRIDITDGRFSFWHGGLFVDNTDSDDMVLTDEADLNATYSSQNQNSTITITFTGATNTASDTFSIRTATDPTNAAATIDLVDFCTTSPNCADENTSASAFYATAVADAAFTKEFTIQAPSTNGLTNNQVRIIGPPALDYEDYSSVVGSVGNISIDRDPSTYKWYVPYTNASNSNTLSLLVGDNAELNMSFSAPLFYNLSSSSSNNTMVASAVNSNGDIIIGARNSSGNLDLYSVASNLTAGANITNIFDMTGFLQVEDFNLSIGMNDHIFIGAKSKAFRDSVNKYYPSAAVIRSDLSETSSTMQFLTTTNYLMQPGTDQVKVIAHPSEDGAAFLAITTNSNHYEDDANGTAAGSGIPNQAHLAKIYQNTSNFSQQISFYDYQLDIASSNLASPALNSSANTLNGGAIAVSPVFTGVTRGHADTSTNIAEDNSKDALFFVWHDGSGTNEIEGGMFNVELEQMDTNSTSVSGAFPAILSN